MEPNGSHHDGAGLAGRADIVLGPAVFDELLRRVEAPGRAIAGTVELFEREFRCVEDLGLRGSGPEEL